MATERLRQYTALGGTEMMMPGQCAQRRKRQKPGKCGKFEI
jgi:hypothetical protein